MRVVLLLLLSSLPLVAGRAEALAQNMAGGEMHQLGGEMGPSALEVVAPSTGCPALPDGANVLAGLRFESYANNDPITGLIDQGSEGLDFAQAVGSAQPTARMPCEAGKLNGQPCAEGDGDDSLATAVISSQAQPSLVCVLAMESAADSSSSVYYVSGGNGTGEHEIIGANSIVTARAGTNLNDISEQFSAGAYETVCVHFSGANSEVWLNGASVLTGDTGSESFNGMHLFSRYNGLGGTSGRIAEVIYYDAVADADAMVTAVSAAWQCVYGGGFPQGVSSADDLATVDVPVDGRWKQYALRLHKRGRTPAQIRDRLIARGLERELAARMAKAVRGRKGRDRDTLHTVNIALVTRYAERQAHADAIAAALCKPLADEDGGDHADTRVCIQAERQYLDRGLRCSAAAPSVPLVAGAQARLTAGEAARVQAVVTARPGLRAASDPDSVRAKYKRLIEQAGAALPGSPALVHCEEPDA